MTEYRTRTGKVITDEDIEGYVAEAEAGYDVDQLRTRGRDLTSAEKDRIKGHLTSGVALADLPSEDSTE